MKIDNQQFEIEIIDEPCYSASSTDNIRKYSKEYLLGEDFRNAPRFGIFVKNSDGFENSCFILGNSIGHPTHDNMAVVVGKNLFVSIGNLVCCFDIPSLTLVWHREVDTGISYSVHVSPDKKGIISHGELEITKVSFDGEIIWSVSGKDIFTGGFTIFSDHIEVVDFNNERYNITLSDGQISLQEKGG